MRSMDLPDLLLAQVALSSADPSSWARVNSNAHAVLNKDGDFQAKWFMQWQPILLPHRPWQYAVLTWRRMQGAPPRMVAQFMLRVLQAKQQQQPARQQSVPVPHPESVAGRFNYVTSGLGCEGQFGGAFPDLYPLPSTLRKVRKLLRQQQAAADLEAVLLLCPCAADLLCQYASRDATAHNAAVLHLRRDVSSTASEPLPLLQRLTQHVFHSGRARHSPSQLYTVHPSRSSKWQRHIYSHRLGCFAALAAGHVPRLLLSLPMAFTQQKPHSSKPLLLTMLLPYAVRYSNADCVRAVLLLHADSRLDALAPQHLAMAASRMDPWAAGVVRLLMQLLGPKQLKPSHMWPAYKAAAVTGYLPVLALLLSHAASAPHQHMPVLLQAVADSSNSAVAELLLGDTAAALLQLQRCQQGSRAAQQQLQGCVQQLRAGCADLGVRTCVELLGGLLPSLDVGSGMLVVRSLEAEAEAVQLLVAERLWALLPAGTQAKLQEVCLRSPGVVQAVATMQHGQHSYNSLENIVTTKLQFSRGATGLLYLLQHRCLPVTKTSGSHMPSYNTRMALKMSLQAGTGVYARQVQQLYNLLKAQEGLHPQTAMSAGTVSGGSAGADLADAALLGALGTAMSTIKGRLSAACAACDAAAVAQLEQLFMLCYMLLTPPAMHPGVQYRPATTASIAPTLPVSLAGGKVVTVAHLSHSLGLPWGLLVRLLGAAGFDSLAGAGAVGAGSSSGSGSSKGSSSSAAGAGSSTGGSRSGGCSSMVLDAMLAVEAPQAAIMQGVLCMTSRISLMPGPTDRVALSMGPVAQMGQMAKHMVAYGYDLLSDREGDDSVSTDEQRSIHTIMRIALYPHYKEHLQGRFSSQVAKLTSRGCRPQDEQQQGPPPLWQQALLQLVAQQAPVLRGSCSPPVPGQPFAPWAGRSTSAVELSGATDVLLHGLQAGRSAQEVQDFISSRLLQSTHATLAQPAAAFSVRDQAGVGPPSVAPWGTRILRGALILRAPELLAWSLQPERQQVLWGSDVTWTSCIDELARAEGLSPITCRSAANAFRTGRRGSLLLRYSVQLKQQQQDRAEMQQQREQLLGPDSSSSSSCGPMVAAAGPVPPFAASAVQLALTLLQHPDAPPETLNDWLRWTMGVSSTLADLVRARAIVAAVAAAKVIPPGARAVLQEAVRQVLAVGDPDLWSVVLLWSHRLPVQIDESDDDEPAVPLDPADDDGDDA